MSLSYSILTRIDAKYNSKNIKSILNKGHEHHFIYYQFVLGEMNIASPELSPEEATNSVIRGLPEDDMHCLTVQILNTYATLHFWNNGTQMVIMLSGLSQIWSKIFEDGNEDIDVARYAKALLDLVSDFKILEMHIEKN